MGRLPSTWANRIIQSRWPYNLPGELLLTSAQTGRQYPDATFQNGVDRPFEIHRMIPRVYALDDEGILLPVQPAQELMQGLVRAMIVDLGRVQQLTRSPTLIDALTKGSSERTWEWADPMYLIRSEQLQVTLDALTFPTIEGLVSLRVVLDFQGYLCVVSPPSENR